MEMTSIPYGTKDKWLSKLELDRYFSAGSLEELIFALRQYAGENYLRFDVIISPDYVKWEQAHHDVLLSVDTLTPLEPYFIAHQSTHALYGLRDKASNGTPLSRQELNNVIQHSPSDLAEKYLRFKLYDVDRKSLSAIIPERSTDADEELEPLEYSGLRINGTDVTYLGEQIRLAYKERHLLRIFIENAERLVFPDTLIEDREIISDDKEYRDPRARVSKLVSALRLKLVDIIHQPCIINENKEGWKLVIK